MGKPETFRVRIFGGYDKEEVQEYIQGMEKEIDNLKALYQKGKEELKQIGGHAEDDTDERNVELQALQKENQELRETCRNLQEQLRTKETGKQEDIGEFGDRELIAEILADARKSAELIKEEAFQEGQEIIKNAQEEAKHQKEKIVGRINGELVDKGIELIAARHKISRYVNEVKQIQEELYGMYSRMNAMLENMPVRLDNYWEGEYFRVLTEQQEESVLEISASSVLSAGNSGDVKRADG